MNFVGFSSNCQIYVPQAHARGTTSTSTTRTGKTIQWQIKITAVALRYVEVLALVACIMKSVLCILSQVLVWSPNAGLGDSLLALVTGVVVSGKNFSLSFARSEMPPNMQTAIKTGRLFFIDWTQPHGGWRVGLGQPSAYSGDWAGAFTFPWDWQTYACREALEEASKTKSRVIARVSGSITASNWVLDEVPKYANKWFERQYGEGGRAPSGRAPQAEYDDVIPRRFQIAGRVVRPSAEVLEVPFVYCETPSVVTGPLSSQLACFRRWENRTTY